MIGSGSKRGVVEVLIAANILLFIVRLVNPVWTVQTLGLRAVGVFVKPWTLATNMFVHAGFGHLLFNMIALFFFGLYLERLVGEDRFTQVYFVGGLFASLSYVFTALAFGIPSPYTYAVGASGAIFAVMGALVVLRPNMTVYVNFIFPMPLWVLALLYTFWALPAMFASVGNVAYNAHLGGLIAGLLYGRHFKRQMPAHPQGGMHGYRFY